MEGELIVRLNYIKNIKFEERDSLKKYIMHRNNCKRMVVISSVLAKFIYKYPIYNITELNTLHYAAAVTLDGVKDPKSTKLKHPFEPGRLLNEKIKRIRKWIGRIIAIKQGRNLTQKVKLS